LGTVGAFYIAIRRGSKDYKYKIEQISAGLGVERYKLTAANKILVLENNRPIFIRKGLKHRKPDWKLVQGEINNPSFLNDITDAINRHIEQEAG
jgi:hypothetical protein